MVKNINSALFDIKASEERDANRRCAGEIREGIKQATRNARLLRQKIVSKQGHYHDEPLKPALQEIMAKRPLILRKNLRIPLYPHALAGTVYDTRRPKKVAPVTPAGQRKPKRYTDSGDGTPVLELSPVAVMVQGLEAAREEV